MLSIRKSFYDLVEVYGIPKGLQEHELEAEEKTVRERIHRKLEESYRILIDEDSRQKYDRLLRGDRPNLSPALESTRRSVPIMEEGPTLSERRASLEPEKMPSENMNTRTLTRFSGNANQLFQQGRQHFEERNFKEALYFFEEALNLIPHNSRLQSWIAECLFKLPGRLVEAEKVAEAAVNNDKSNVRAHLIHGKIRLLNSKQILARYDFEKVLELDPGNQEALKELSRLNRRGR